MLKRVLLGLALCVFTHAVVDAAVPSSITVQGRVTDALGNPLPAGSKSFSFRIFSDTTAGAQVWPPAGSEMQNIATDAEGLWVARVGAVTALTDAVFSNVARWLEITVNGTTLPRVRLLSEPYAFRVATVDGASGGNVTSQLSIGPGHTNTGSNGFAVGSGNRALGEGAQAAGRAADATHAWSTVGGGFDNDATSERATVGGGQWNIASADGSAIAGGIANIASGYSSAVGGGYGNVASETGASVAGGMFNRARGAWSFVGGGGGWSGADSNSAVGVLSTIVGGIRNSASGEASAVGGGSDNTTSGNRSIVAGGRYNKARGEYSVVGGGAHNRANAPFSVIAGGGGINEADSNSVTASHSFIGGGSRNRLSDGYSVIAGGLSNRIDGFSPFYPDLYSVIAGGNSNLITSVSSVIGGGEFDTASGEFNTIAGGFGNRTDEPRATVGGGAENKALNFNATVSGGLRNIASGGQSTIGGGSGNLASGIWSTIPGGTQNRAAGNYSFAVGNRAKADHEGSFVWGDFTNVDFASTAPNQFLIRAAGGMGIGTNAPTKQLEVLDDSAGALNYPLKLTNQGAVAGTATGIIFQVDAGGARGKGGLVYERTDTWNRGAFHFLQNNAIGSGNADLSNKVFSIGNNGNVGIGQSAPGNILTVVQGSATDPVADAWGTYSSRRWKENIRPIEGALRKIQQLQGVEYDWKQNDQHDIGLIAEEVGKVIPEIVAYEENGIDAKSVDYARLVALLIEGMKEQQQLIDKQQKDIEVLKRAIQQ